MAEEKLLHWDMTPVYPNLESQEFEAGFEATIQDIKGMVELFDKYGIEKKDEVPLDEATISTWGF